MAPHIALSRRLSWSPDTGLREEKDHGLPVVAADSWLVADGEVRAIERHRSRFGRACAERGGLDRRTLDGFWADMVAALPRQGDWFPRVELTGGERPRLDLLLRPAPTRGTRVRVLCWDGADPREHPRVKGPDLSALAEVREQAIRGGADDALLTTESGVLTESTTSALLWWEGDDLCVPSPDLDVLPSVTAGLLVEHAHDLGVAVRPRNATPSRLHGCETWLVNALHGIRVVTEWVGSPVRPGAERRAQRWRAHLDALRRPLPW
ncbi:aminotransferase class IV [Thermobifida halotolerans]|uniref:Aminotransferase class IV n=1 Tax=Thermobifida halotolerans TaxID=483545 RepID=A0A399FXS6_9ACTN|nr:aminotransferase class IV [Thermobifida halotolerans]UOE18870.1 aminotransferase class IV [Thermobifida halotolerans]